MSDNGQQPSQPSITILPPQSMEVRLAVIEERTGRLTDSVKEIKADLKANTEKTEASRSEAGAAREASRRFMVQQWFTLIGSTFSIIVAQLLIHFLLH